jgi:hypothetical protein
MWWQSVDSMLKTNYSKLGFLEAISFASFQNNNRVIQTVDWLDVAVEHLSKYVKHFSIFEDDVEHRVANLMEGYIERSKHYCPEANIHSAIPSTIAILPLRVSSLERQIEVRRLKLQLTATLASLWAAGFPRAVIVGVSRNETIVAQESFELLKDHLSTHFMELQYIVIESEDLGLIPKVALARFQQVITNQQHAKQDIPMHDAEMTEWLGNNRSNWKYVYFTEPDLILHIRPEAVPSLSIELEKGHIINAHRLQPLPHIQQFSDIIDRIEPSRPSDAQKLRNKLLPNKASFGAIHSLNPSDGDVCCDQGKFYPSNLEDPALPVMSRKIKGCLWEFCGFGPKANHSDWNTVVTMHEWLVMYPFLSLEQGTQIPVVHHGQRVCTPRRDGTVCSSDV